MSIIYWKFGPEVKFGPKFGPFGTNGPNRTNGPNSDHNGSHAQRHPKTQTPPTQRHPQHRDTLNTPYWPVQTYCLLPSHSPLNVKVSPPAGRPRDGSICGCSPCRVCAQLLEEDDWSRPMDSGLRQCQILEKATCLQANISTIIVCTWSFCSRREVLRFKRGVPCCYELMWLLHQSDRFQEVLSNHSWTPWSEMCFIMHPPRGQTPQIYTASYLVTSKTFF